MSIILDALRMGRGKPAAGTTSTPAQTDAILQTLGYRRSSSSPLDRLKRFVVYLGVAVAFAALLAVAVIWLESPNGKVIFFPDGSIERP